MLPAEELEQVKFIPTIPEFVTWIEKKWHDLSALSDIVSVCTYAKMCSDMAVSCVSSLSAQQMYLLS